MNKRKWLAGSQPQVKLMSRTPYVEGIQLYTLRKHMESRTKSQVSFSILFLDIKHGACDFRVSSITMRFTNALCRSDDVCMLRWTADLPKMVWRPNFKHIQMEYVNLRNSNMPQQFPE